MPPITNTAVSPMALLNGAAIAIDTGIAKGGPLTCLVLEGDQVATLQPEGPQDLPLGSGLGGEGILSRLSGLWR